MWYEKAKICKNKSIYWNKTGLKAQLLNKLLKICLMRNNLSTSLKEELWALMHFSPCKIRLSILKFNLILGNNTSKSNKTPNISSRIIKLRWNIFRIINNQHPNKGSLIRSTQNFSQSMAFKISVRSKITRLTMVWMMTTRSKCSKPCKNRLEAYKVFQPLCIIWVLKIIRITAINKTPTTMMLARPSQLKCRQRVRIHQSSKQWPLNQHSKWKMWVMTNFSLQLPSNRCLTELKTTRIPALTLPIPTHTAFLL